MEQINPYLDAGFASRSSYLKSLTEEYPANIVYLLANLFGPSEDFDGLVSQLEDFADEDSRK